jgi:hypothetical protein
LQLIELDDEKVNQAMNERLNRQCADIDIRYAEINALIETGGCSPKDPAVLAYDEYLTHLARYSCIHDLVNSAAAELKTNRGAGMHVFGVAPREYNKWKNPYRLTDPDISPIMTGIPAVRQHLLQLPEERYFQSYRALIFRKLSELINKADRIIKKHGDEPSFEKLRKDFKRLIQTFQSSLPTGTAALMVHMVPNIWSPHPENHFLEKVEETLSKWAEIHWKTYGMILREGGISIKSRSKKLKDTEINWNRDLLLAIEPEEKEGVVWRWTRQVDSNIQGLKQPLEVMISSFIDQMFDIIDQSSCDSALKERLNEEWKTIHQNIAEHLKDLPTGLSTAVDAVYEEVTTEEDTRCMIATQEVETYQKAASVPQGVGTKNRQTFSMKSGITGSKYKVKNTGFLNRYHSSAVDKMKAGLQSVLDAFLNAISTELSEFIDITEQLVLEPGQERPEIVDTKVRLEKAKGQFQAGIQKLQEMFPERTSQTAQKSSVSNSKPSVAGPSGTRNSINPVSTSSTPVLVHLKLAFKAPFQSRESVFPALNSFGSIRAPGSSSSPYEGFKVDETKLKLNEPSWSFSCKSSGETPGPNDDDLEMAEENFGFEDDEMDIN